MPVFDKFMQQSMEKGRAKLQIRWHTPDEYLNAARELMGGIDIDPATDEIAQKRIQAKVYYTKETNGLDKIWQGRLLLCPPYQEGLIQKFIFKAISEYRLVNVSEGIILTHTNETHADYFQMLLGASSACCFVRDYIRWVSGHTEEEYSMEQLGVKWHPEYTKHGNAVVYLGINSDSFKTIFTKFGVCYVK